MEDEEEILPENDKRPVYPNVQKRFKINLAGNELKSIIKRNDI